MSKYINNLYIGRGIVFRPSLLRSGPPVPVFLLLGYLIGISGNFIMLFILVVLVIRWLGAWWYLVLLQEHANFWFIQYDIDYDVYISRFGAPWDWLELYVCWILCFNTSYRPDIAESTDCWKLVECDRHRPEWNVLVRHIIIGFSIEQLRV